MTFSRDVPTPPRRNATIVGGASRGTWGSDTPTPEKERAITREEQASQIAGVEYLRWLLPRGSLVIHVPNGGKRTKAEAGILKAMGVVAGFPDVLIFLAGGVCVALEWKRKGGKPRTNQGSIHLQLEQLGFKVGTVESGDDAKRLLLGWGLKLRGK